MCKDSFEDKYDPTVVVGFEQHFDIEDKRSVALNIYDFMGNKSWDELRAEFLPLLHAVVFCYDVTNPASLESLDHWRREIDPIVSKKCVSFLCGCKSDSSDKKVSESMANAWIKQKGSKHLETSAKTGNNVLKLLRELQDLPV